MIKQVMKGDAIEDLSQLQFPVWGMPKLDGFRCWLDRRPLTTRLMPFRNPTFDKALTKRLPKGVCLDSEVVVGKRRGPGVLSRTSSGVTKGSLDPDWRLWVFDCVENGQLSNPYHDRYNAASRWVKSLGDPRIRLIKAKLIKNVKQARKYVDRCLKRGFEGAMFRKADAPYKEGRSTVRQGMMVKYKPFTDAEGEVIGYFEEEKNNNEAVRQGNGKLKRSSARVGKEEKGTLGGLILKDLKSGIEVRIDGGFTKDQRDLWKIRRRLIGQVVTYKKQLMGEKDKPRSPQFKCFRPGWDFDPHA